MKSPTTTTVVAMAAAFLCCLSPAQAGVTTSFDKFKRETVISLEPDKHRIDGTVQLIAYATVGPGPEKQYRGTLVDLVAVNRDWRYLECHSTHWLADGVPVQMPPADHEGRVSGTIVVEGVYSLNVSWASLVQIASAKKVEYEICNDEYVLDSVTQAGLRTFITKIQQAMKY